MLKLLVTRPRLAAAIVVGVLGCNEPATGIRPVVAVSIAPNLILLPSGADTLLSAIVLGNNAMPLEGRAVQWATANAARATVNDSGRVRALPNLGLEPLSVTITATSAGRTGSATVAVQPSIPVSLTLGTGSIELSDGEFVGLVPTVLDADGSPLVGRPVVWTSRDTLVARAVGAGSIEPSGFLGTESRSTYVVATLDDLVDSVLVTVLPTTAATLSVTPETPFLAVGGARQLRAILFGVGGSQIYGEEVEWASASPSIVEVLSDPEVSKTGGTAQARGVGEGLGQVEATSVGLLATVNVTVSACGAGPPGDFALEVRFIGPPPTAEVEVAFECAAARIRGAVVDALNPVTFTNFDASACSSNLQLNESVPGLLIFSTIEAIDGPGNILGSAGPCYLRNSNSLPVVGRMRFDSADLAQLAADGGLQTVILHEMLHVVGLGTVWEEKDLIAGIGATPRFLGPLARAACINDLNLPAACEVAVPVEDCLGLPDGLNCGGGTLNSHWKESIFRQELMTGFLNSGINPFTRMTIQSLADLGYGVDVDVADDFLGPDPAFQALLQSGAPLRRLPEPTLPTHTVDRHGRPSPIIYPQR